MNHSLVNITPTLCKALDLPMVENACSDAIDQVVDLASGAQRVLFFSPDAIGKWLFDKYRSDFDGIFDTLTLQVPLDSVMPSVTPVCYGTMLSGFMPAEHGIKQYIKYPLTVETLFHSLDKAGKKAAIVAKGDSSCEIIFRNTPATVFVVQNDRECLEKSLELIAQDTFDFILVYQCEYDDKMHATQPESEAALAAMRYHIDSFCTLAAAAKKQWQGKKALYTFSPDHGIHTDPVTKLGTHGTELDADMKIIHLFGVTK